MKEINVLSGRMKKTTSKKKEENNFAEEYTSLS
jgi:hypothetical protein